MTLLRREFSWGTGLYTMTQCDYTVWLKLPQEHQSGEPRCCSELASSVGACYTGEVDVYGGFWGHVRSHVFGLAKVFKNEEFKIPWQWRSHLGLGCSLPSISVTFLYTCPNPHPGPLSPSSQACPPSLSQDPSLCRFRVTCPGLAQGYGFPAGPLCIQQG